MIDMTLKKKILVGYGIVFILMGLVIAWSVVNLVSLGNASEAILSENYRSIRAAENMVNALQRQDNGILLIYLGEPGKGADLFRENEAIFFEWLTRAKDNITIEGEADLVKAIETDYMAYRRFFLNGPTHNTAMRSLSRSLRTIKPSTLFLQRYKANVSAYANLMRGQCTSPAQRRGS